MRLATYAIAALLGLHAQAYAQNGRHMRPSHAVSALHQQDAGGFEAYQGQWRRFPDSGSSSVQTGPSRTGTRTRVSSAIRACLKAQTAIDCQM